MELMVYSKSSHEKKNILAFHSFPVSYCRENHNVSFQDDLFHLLIGSVSSCDAFLSLFQSHGLKPEAICPCATSAEAMTVAIRRYRSGHQCS